MLVRSRHSTLRSRERSSRRGRSRSRSGSREDSHSQSQSQSRYSGRRDRARGGQGAQGGAEDDWRKRSEAFLQKLSGVPTDPRLAVQAARQQSSYQVGPTAQPARLSAIFPLSGIPGIPSLPGPDSGPPTSSRPGPACRIPGPVSPSWISPGQPGLPTTASV